jgi:hypothetical protein
MQLQTTKNIYRHDSLDSSAMPIPKGGAYEINTEVEIVENKKFTVENLEINLPILATANDLREVAKFFRNKPNGVSVVEAMNAEPRRVFDARKIAAYEFWGVLSYNDERLYLTPLGEELSINTEIESEIHRRILRSVPAYVRAIEWIYAQKLEIATYVDVANFWRQSQTVLNLSRENESNIEAVIVSFFSLCHTAELGTATVGKRGQPARLSVRLDQVKSFLNARTETNDFARSSPQSRPSIYHFEKIGDENIESVYISAGNNFKSLENLSAALELADFGSVSFQGEKCEHGFLPAMQISEMRSCQAAIFLLDENDCSMQNRQFQLRCERITEISVAQALFGDRVVVLWNGEKQPPESFEQIGLNFYASRSLDWETNVKLVKCLKNFKK